MSASQAAPPLDEQVQQLAQDTAEFARKQDADPGSQAALATIAARWQSPLVPVVVVGEVSRGKSTLINALLGERVLPADFRATTASWVQISYGPEMAAAAIVLDGSGQPVSVDLDPEADLETYLTVRGEERFAARHGKASRVMCVNIAYPAQILSSGLALIDTPGVGGLQAAHLRATMSALSGADAMIFVTKPGEPVSESERRFLAEAVGRIAECVVVQTHRDKVMDAAKRLKDDLATLQDAAEWTKLLKDPARAQALADVFASAPAVSVSATNALDARAMAAGTPAAQKLLTASNFEVLEDLLETDVIARSRQIHRERILRLMESILSGIKATPALQLSVLRGEADAAKAIAEREQRIQKWLAHNGDYWRKELDAAFEKLRSDLKSFGQSRSSELDTEYREKFGRIKPKTYQEDITPILTEPDAAFAEMIAMAKKGLEDGVERIRGLLETDDLGDELSRMKDAKAVFSRLAGTETIDISSRPDVDDLIRGITGGLAIGGASIMVGAAIPVLWPFLAGAGAFVAVNRWRKARNQAVQHAMEVLRTVRTEIETTAVNHATTVASAAKDKIALEIKAALAETQRRVDKDRQDIADAATMSPEKRAARIAALEAIVAKVDTMLNELGALRVAYSAEED